MSTNKQSIYVLALQKGNFIAVLGCFRSLEVLTTHFINFCKNKFKNIPDAILCKKVVEMQATQDWIPLEYGYNEKMIIYYSLLYIDE